MNITPAFYCKYCRFYHGFNQVVCGFHPYGPDGEACSDYVPKESELERGKTYTDKFSSDRSSNWIVWRQALVLVLGMLIGIFGSGCLAWWATTCTVDRQDKQSTHIYR